MTVRHGTYLGYVADGCRDDCCRRPWTARMELNEHLRDTGRQRYVDAAPVREHLADLQDRLGVSLSALMIAAGFNRGRTVNDRIHRDHAVRLLALDADTLPPSTVVDATRMHELVAAIVDRTGWSLAEVARQAGVCPQTLRRNRRQRTSLANVAAVQAVHDDLDAPRCEDCGGTPLDGGRWCLRCFQTHANPRPAPATGCGTPAGYTAHRRAGDTPCPACREAHSRASARRAS